MKKPFLIFASILLAVMSYAGVVSLWAESSVVAASSTVKLYINPATAGVTTGYTTVLQLRLYVNTSAKVDYAEAHVSFPVSNLEVVSISKQGSYFNNGGGPSISYNNSNGLISVMGSGPVLGTVDDVLLATVTFKGKTAGTAAVSYTSASQAGDITNGGHVKNVLDTRVGATVNISNPVPVRSGGSTGGGTTGSSTPPATSSPTVAPTTSTPTASNTGTAVTPSATTPGQGSSSPKDVSASLEQTVTAPPSWLQFLLPAAGGISLLGMGGLGYVLYLKRRRSGVLLPPGDETGAETMPSTEAQDMGIPIFGLGSEVAQEEAMPETSVTETLEEEAVPPVFNSHDTLDIAPIPSGPDPASLDSVLAQPAELLPTELQDTAAGEVAALPEAPVEAPATPVDVIPEPVEPLEAAPAVAAPLPPVQSLAPQAPVAVTPLPVPVPSPAPVYVQPTAPVIPVPVSTGDPNAPIDYKNLPDMYDLGEQRLQNEGHAAISQPASKVQPV